MSLDMYRVVTVRFLKEGTGRTRVVSKGPLHPDVEHANRWADYLRKMGGYYDVRVESNTPIRSKNLDTGY